MNTELISKIPENLNQSEVSIMVGVSTGQNITNLIPAVQTGMKVTKFVLLETTTAKRLKWSYGLKSVLEGRGLEVELIDLEGIDSHISNIQKRLLDRFESEKTPIVWNLGGGQKPQQIPIWEVFKIRNEKYNIPDIVCYANQDDKGILEFWDYKCESLKTSQEEIFADLTAKEIFEVFGFGLKGKPQLIYENSKVCNLNKAKDLLQFQDFREFLLKLPVRNEESKTKELSWQLVKEILDKEKKLISKSFSEACINLISLLGKEQNGFNNFLKHREFQENKTNQALKNVNFTYFLLDLIKKNLPFEIIDIKENELRKELNLPEISVKEDFLKVLTKGRFSKASFYFEQIVIQRVMKMLQEKEHKIVQAFANLEIERNGQVVAEYDVLCVTEKGTILALDAKTFEFANKDIDARLYNLEQGSGFYRNFSAIFPFDYEDIEQDWLKPIRRLPFDLARRRFKFFVINDSTNENFWVKQENGNILKSKEKPQEQGWIECKVLDNFLHEK